MASVGSVVAVVGGGVVSVVVGSVSVEGGEDGGGEGLEGGSFDCASVVVGLEEEGWRRERGRCKKEGEREV